MLNEMRLSLDSQEEYGFCQTLNVNLSYGVITMETSGLFKFKNKKQFDDFVSAINTMRDMMRSCSDYGA